MEKPFGSDQESARHLNKALANLVPEDHIHRVDHFLGKATVLNILGLRFANTFLEPVWNREHIEKVEIIFDEDLALEGRARYYDGAGALRDMIQSHLLQVMALMAMEPPASMDERDLRDGVAAVLRASSIKAPYAKNTRRARYTAGSINGRKVPDYAKEDGVDAARGTETLPKSRWRSTTGAGRACRSSCAREGDGHQAQGGGDQLPARAAPARRDSPGWTPPTSCESVSARTPCSSTSM